MSTSAYGAAADHAGLAGNTLGDPHPQYTASSQGLLAARPVIASVRNGTRYYATDVVSEYVASNGAWIQTIYSPPAVTRNFANRFLMGV